MYYCGMIPSAKAFTYFGRDISVKFLQRYMAICRGYAMSLVLFFDLKSSGLISKYLADFLYRGTV